MKRGRQGMTIIEITCTTLIFGVLSLVMLNGLDLSESSRRAVDAIATQNAELRAAMRAISDDLRVSSEDRTTLEDLSDGSTLVTLQLPIVVGGVLAWGVPGEYVARVGGDDQAGWSVRYEVLAGEDAVRRLMRRVLDDAGNQMRSEVIATGLALGTDGGAANPPGIAVARTGDVWEVSVALAGFSTRVETMNVGNRK
jgi:type II secretory pathway component PulJ